MQLQIFSKMEIPVIKIGNSKETWLHKTLLEKIQMAIKPLAKPRKGWEKAFRKMAENEEDRLLFDDVFEDENLKEWK